MAHVLPELQYPYDALEPYLDTQTMEIHHKLHHGGYVNKLNAALEGTGLEEKDLVELIQNLDQVPEDKRTAVRNNGGGHYNHSFFWRGMAPQSGGEPTGNLATKITEQYGSFQAFKEAFTKAAETTFGSGWTWLYSDDSGALQIGQYSDHLSPIMDGHKGLLCIDVWEHAYYLKYQNRRPEFIAAWWNVIKWAEAERLYDEAKA